MRTDYEYRIPSIVSEHDVRRLRGSLDMRTGLILSYYDLSLRIVRLTGIPNRDRELRALLISLGYAPEPEDPEGGCQHRPATQRSRRIGTNADRRRGDAQATPRTPEASRRIRRRRWLATLI